MCENIDKISRDFIWGSREESKGTHLITWDDLCKLMINGGLGIKKAKPMNQALLMKVGWGLISKKDSLWARVLRNKYGCREDVISRVTRRIQNSNLWSGICIVWKRVEGTSWRLGNESSISFWNDCLYKTGLRLKDVAIVPLDDSEISKIVSDFVLPNGEWDVDELK